VQRYHFDMNGQLEMTTRNPAPLAPTPNDWIPERGRTVFEVKIADNPGRGRNFPLSADNPHAGIPDIPAVGGDFGDEVAYSQGAAEPTFEAKAARRSRRDR
jgi:hypothetical protein